MTGTADPAARHDARMPCLDGLRGLAAVMVVFSHLPDFGFAHVIAPLCGADGVLIFFALSGFLMGDLYLSRPPTADTVKGYVAARIARIAPLYFTVVIASFLITTFVTPDFVYRFPPFQFARLLTFNGSASVFWSISPEVQFYFVFIPLWLLHARLRHDGGFALVLGGLAALSIVTVAWWPGILVVSKFHIFACGVLAALLRRHAAPQLSDGAVLALHMASVAVIAMLLVPGAADALLRNPHAAHEADPTLAAFYGDPVRCLVAGFLAFSLSFESRIGATLFANPAALLLGRCSFSIYLLHLVVFFVVLQSGAMATLPPALVIVAMLVATLLVSVASYRLVEAPARGHARRFLLAFLNARRPAVLLHRNTA